MTQVLVWDPLGEDERDARVFEDGDILTEHDAEYYACQYAEEDSDGHLDGIYTEGRDLKVKLPDGRVFDVSVHCELEPQFYASPARKSV